MKNDFFSKQSDFYAKYRPTYPEDLYHFISGQVEEKNLVWDVATGNGQAAVALSSIFKKVYATDFSENQLKNATQKPNIIYVLEYAESVSLANESADLITVATAVHWFDKEKFFREAGRVLKPGGVLFVWSYGGCRVNETVDKVLDRFCFEFLLDYWHEGAKENWVDKYQSLKMPYPLMNTPEFIVRINYSMEEVLNYMFSWSGVQEYISRHSQNPLDFITEELSEAWGNPQEKKEIKWYLHTKCCRKIS